MIQEYLKIGEVNLPVIIEDGVKYYPISYLTVKVLLRPGKGSFISKKRREEYKDYIKEFNVKFDTSVNIQKTNCISEEALKFALSKTHQGRLSIEQRENQNLLHMHLGIKLLTEREHYINKLTDDQINEHEEYVQEIIRHEIKNSNMDKFHLCPKCDKYYPITNTFFRLDPKTNTGHCSICVVCEGKSSVFRHPDKEVTNARKQGVGIYEAMKNDNIIKIYDAYLRGGLKRLPDCYNNKDGYLEIISYLYDENMIDENNLTQRILMREYKLKNISEYLSMDDIFSHLFGEDFYCYRWKYPTYRFKEGSLTYSIVNKIIHNYINENNVEIENIFTYDYDDLIKKAKVRGFAGEDLLYFIVQFHNFEYPGYMFRSTGVNYYKKDESLKFDLKYLIEQDMKLEKSKVPLYLTKNVLRQRCNPLYHQIVTNKNHNLFYWVDQLYPNMFTETDFEINAYRSEFDSDTECFIHEILKEKFQSVIYNQRNTERTIALNGMVPDWFVFTSKGVWIIEYFGMYSEKYTQNSRVKDYKIKMEDKLNRYEEIEGYKLICLYPEDIDNDFKGCREKLREIEESQ